MSESCINDEIPECKCLNGPIKSDNALHKKNDCNQNTDEDSNNLSTTSVNNCKTSENNVIRTNETSNNNDVIKDKLATPAFQSTLHHSSSVGLKPNLLKEEILLQ